MLHPSANVTGEGPSSAIMTETIASRFGDITVDSAKSLLFSRGLLGMPDKRHFVLAQFPNPKMQQFMLLQSTEDKSLSFITLPLELHNAIIAEADLKAACRELQFDDAKLALLLIVSVHRTLDQTRLSVNARAPLLLDVDRRIGMQHVFQHDQYKVQHML